jgi:hypothetical protein|tara:strand:- start:8134 stop:10479 length:2346 start_codon:yes stop_codon:yes gene_type:complete
MIPHTKQHNLATGGAVGESKEYSFEMNAHMASLLSDKLYSNKVEAIIRELACNAQDSHVETGNTDPIDVHLPTAIEPFFYIEDFGTGLSHDEVMSLYTTYGASTKRGTNTQVGQFGLGSKVFFAYTEQATITATKDGIRQVYSAFKDEQGMPNITTMGAAIHDNSLPNGVKVYVGVLPGDIEAFTESAQQIFRRFDPCPKILGGSDYEIAEYEAVLDGIGWIMRREESSSYSYRRSSRAAPFAIQGNVAYRISEDEMKPHMEGTGLQFMLDLPFDITFQIGELDVSSSREELSYNKQTLAAIISRFGEINKELTTTLIPDLFSSCTTQWEATKQLAKLIESSSNSHYTDLIKGAAEFNGKQVDDKIDISLRIKNPSVWQGSSLTSHSTSPFIPRFHKDTSVIFLNEREFSLKTSSFAKDQVRPEQITLVGNREYLLLWDDRTKQRQPSRLKAYMAATYGVAKRDGYRRRSRNNDNSDYPYGVYVIQCEKKSEFLKVIAEVGDPPWKVFNDLVPELPKAVRVKQPGGSTVNTVNRASNVTFFSGHSRQRWNCNQRDEKRKQWTDCVVDTTVQTEGYYVDLHAWEVKDGPRIEQLYQMASGINLIQVSSQIYGCPGSIKNPFKALPGWKNLIESLTTATLEWFEDPLNCAAVAINDALELEDVDYDDKRDIKKIREVLTQLSKYGTIPVGSVAKDYLNYHEQLRLKADDIRGYCRIQNEWLYSDIIDKLLAKENKNKKSIVKTLLKRRTEFYAKYPMIRLVTIDVDSLAAKLICQYIKEMEKN